MIIRRTNILLYPAEDNSPACWDVSYILDTKYRRYRDLLKLIMHFCNDNTTISGDSTQRSAATLYRQVRTDKPLHSVEHDAIKHVDSRYLLSYKDPTKRRYHELKLIVRWSEGINYIRDIDNKINDFLKQHCLFPTKLKIPKEEK